MENQDMTTPEAREGYYKQMWKTAAARVVELQASERAVDILRSACSNQEGIPINEQSPEPEDMALWAVAKIERLEKELAEVKEIYLDSYSGWVENGWSDERN